MILSVDLSTLPDEVEVILILHTSSVVFEGTVSDERVCIFAVTGFNLDLIR